MMRNFTQGLMESGFTIMLKARSDMLQESIGEMRSNGIGASDLSQLQILFRILSLSSLLHNLFRTGSALFVYVKMALNLKTMQKSHRKQPKKTSKRCKDKFETF